MCSSSSSSALFILFLEKSLIVLGLFHYKYWSEYLLCGRLQWERMAVESLNFLTLWLPICLSSPKRKVLQVRCLLYNQLKARTAIRETHTLAAQQTQDRTDAARFTPALHRIKSKYVSRIYIIEQKAKLLHEMLGLHSNTSNLSTTL